MLACCGNAPYLGIIYLTSFVIPYAVNVRTYVQILINYMLALFSQSVCCSQYL